jgi:hypothetical protein
MAVLVHTDARVGGPEIDTDHGAELLGLLLGSAERKQRSCIGISSKQISKSVVPY